MSDTVEVVIAYSNTTSEIGTIREMPRAKAQAWCADGRARLATDADREAVEHADDDKVPGPTASVEGDELAARGSVTRTEQTAATTTGAASSAGAAEQTSTGSPVDATDGAGDQAGATEQTNTGDTGTGEQSTASSTSSAGVRGSSARGAAKNTTQG